MTSTAAVKSRTSSIGLGLLNFAYPNWGDDANYNMMIIDASISLLGVTGIVGVWQNSTAYTVGQRVVDSTSLAIYQCAVNHTSAASPTTFAADRVANPTFWTAVLTSQQVTNSGSATDNAVARFDLATGKVIQTSLVELDDSGNISPFTNDVGGLGKSGKAWGDLFLANAAVINFNAGNYTLTHAAGILTASGNFTVSGNLIVTGTATVTAAPLTLTGGQIVFPGTQNPSAGANTFDDYEEGTFTPGQTSVGGTITTNGTRTGWYRKIAGFVAGSIDCTITTNGTGATQLNWSGLPFSTTATSACAGIETAATAKQIVGMLNNASTTITQGAFYDGTYPGADGRRFVVNFAYPAA